MAISDCKNWKRFESTHIDHITESIGHLSILTEDISMIGIGNCGRKSKESSQGNNDSFKTAFEEIQPQILAPDSDESCQVLVNENSIREISSDEEQVEEEIIGMFCTLYSRTKIGSNLFLFLANFFFPFKADRLPNVTNVPKNTLVPQFDFIQSS